MTILGSVDIQFTDSSAQFVVVTGEQVFKHPTGSTIPTNTTIALTAVAYGVSSPAYQWQYWDGSKWIQLTKTGNDTPNYTVSYNDPEWGSKLTTRYRCLLNGSFSDEITISKIYDGAAGSSSLTVILTNETSAIPTDSSGNNGIYTGSGTDVLLFEGITPLTYDGIGTNPGSWKISSSGTNVTPSSTFTRVGTTGAYVTVGNHSLMTQDTATITYTITGKRLDGTAISLTKQQTLSKAKQGSKGDPGNDAFTAVLSNESTVFPADINGNVLLYANNSTTLKIYKGATDDTANWTISQSRSTGVTVTEATTSATATVTGLAAANDTGSVTFTATRSGYPTQTKIFSISKAKTGSQGSPATAYWLTVSAAAIQKSASGLYTPSNITVIGNSKSGSSNPSTYAGRFIIYESTDGTTFTTKYTSSSDETSHTYTPSNGIKLVKIEFYLAGGTATLLDTQSIPIVSDGATGQPGNDAITSVLSNESTVFPADSSGNVTSYANNSTTLKIYKGTTDDTANWIISQSISTGVTVTEATTSATATVTGLAAANDTGSVTFTATRSGYPTQTKVFSISKAKAGIKGSTGGTGNNGDNAVGLGIKINQTAFANSSPGESYVYGFDNSGAAADIPGYVYSSGIRIAIPNQAINVSVVGTYYLMFDTSNNFIYGVTVDQLGVWTRYRYGDQYDNTSFTPDPTVHLFIGESTNSSSELVDHGMIWTSPKNSVEMQLFLANVLVNSWKGDAENGATTINGGLLQAHTILAKHLAIGDFTNLATASEVTGNTTSQYAAGATIISGGYIKKAVSTNAYLMVCDYTDNPFSTNDEIYFEFEGLTSSTTKTATFMVWCYDANKAYLGSSGSSTITLTSTNAKYTGTVKLTNANFSTAAYVLIGLNGLASNDPSIKRVAVRIRNAGSLLVDGSITASKLAVTSLDAICATLGSVSTVDNSTSGQITITGSNFTSTKYGTSGKEYVKITNGTLEIKTLSAIANSYQTVTINGNTGINISSDLNTNATLRFDVYETLSTATNMQFGLKATSSTASDTVTLFIESDDNVIVNATNINLNGIINFGSAFQYNNGFINAPGGSVSIAQNTITSNTYIFGSNVMKYDSGFLTAPGQSLSISQNTVTAATLNGQTINFTNSSGTALFQYTNGVITAPGGSSYIGANTIKANTITQLSNEDYKKNIQDWNYNATDMILNTPIRQYQYKIEDDSEFPHVGIIVQEAPVWAIEIEGDGVEPYAMATMSWKAIQELNARIVALETKLGGAA